MKKDKVGFEPTVFTRNTIVFKTNALNRSTTHPKYNFIQQKKGFEPSTLILARLHSTKLSYICLLFKLNFNACKRNVVSFKLLELVKIVICIFEILLKSGVLIDRVVHQLLELITFGTVFNFLYFRQPA